MDCSPSLSLDESDEPQTPPRSPSRLDFCMEDPEDGCPLLGVQDDDELSMGWGCSLFRDDCPYTFVEEDVFAVDTAPLDHSHFLIVEGNKDDPPQTTDAHAPARQPDLPMDEVGIKPQAPVPVRPPCVQFQVDAQECTSPPCPANQKLSYGHHGLSRSALLQQKTFWGSRHEEWAEWQSRMEQGEAEKQGTETSHAYTGIATMPRVPDSPPPYVRTPPSGLERDLPPRKHEQDAHLSIYPRTGDISALRDPYSVDMDRCFFKFPLWTLHKTLYVFDMQQRSASLVSPASENDPAPIQAPQSSSTLSCYTSSTSGDDEESDSTLVVDDSLVAKSPRPPEPLKCASSSGSPSSWNRMCEWDLSWYARWELLIGLLQHDRTKCDALDASTTCAAPHESPVPSSPPERIFRFAVGEDEETDDYEMLVPDSSFCVDFDEECDLAFAFLTERRAVREWSCDGL